MKKTMKIFSFVFCLFMATILIQSCTPEKRLHRLVALHPELSTTDTIHILDTTFLPETRIDTVVHESRLYDTITITKEKLKLRIHKVHDTVYISAEHKADTVIIEKKVPVDRIVHEIPERHTNKTAPLFDLYNLRLLILIILGILFLVFVYRDYPR